MKKLANYIRFIRLQKGLSQDYMAKKMNITVPAYSKIERGLCNISLSRLSQIASTLDVTTTSLVDYFENGADFLIDNIEISEEDIRITDQEMESMSRMKSRIVMLEQNIKQLRSAIVYIKSVAKEHEE